MLMSRREHKGFKMKSERLMNSYANKVLALQKKTQAGEHDFISVFILPPLKRLTLK